jgi:hypothetical protein
MNSNTSVSNRLQTQLGVTIGKPSAGNDQNETSISVTGNKIKGRLLGIFQNLKGIKNLSYFQQHRSNDIKSQAILLRCISEKYRNSEKTASITNEFGLNNGGVNPKPLTTRTLDKLLTKLEGIETTVVAPKPNTRAEAGQIAINASIASFPYHGNLDSINTAEINFLGKATGWDSARELTRNVGKLTKMDNIGHQGLIYDKKSGLTAYVMQNPAQKELRIVFGGTSSGKSFGGFYSRQAHNLGFIKHQWGANKANATNYAIPDSYKQAAQITQGVIDMIKDDPVYKEYSVVTSGHSKGGGEAAFAALKSTGQTKTDGTTTPTKAICFSSAEFGRGIIDSLNEQEKTKALDSITHYNIAGDLVPKMGKLLTGLSHLGKIITLPASGRIPGPLDRHDKFNKQIMQYAMQQSE